jgi:hypothetical protein
MKINDKLANGLYINVSTRPGGGVGLFTGTKISAGAPICEYKGDAFTGDDGHAEISLRYQYTLNSGLDNPLLVYAVKHKPTNSYVDCHPALCKKEMGLGGFINDARSHLDRAVFTEEGKQEQMLEAGYNCQAWAVPNEASFIMIAIREIKTGEELLHDYGDTYWKPLAELEQKKSLEEAEKGKTKVEQKKEDEKEKKDELSPA